MSVRPLPGASYHTIDTFFHSFDHPDLEAAPVHDTSSYGPSEKSLFDGERKYQADARPPHFSSGGRRYRGPPVLLSIIVLCCLAFVASAFWEHSPGRLPLPDVPDRYASLANRLSSAFRTQSSFKTLVDGHYDGALEMMYVPGSLGIRLINSVGTYSCISEQKFECEHDGCGDKVDLRHHLLQAFPLECVMIVSFGVRHFDKTGRLFFFIIGTLLFTTPW
jgi:hypothetical protein